MVCAVRDLDVYIEQPCLTYEECLAVRRSTDHPFVLDENIDGLDMLLCARADLAMDVVNLKISKLGGLTKARLARSVRGHGHCHDSGRQLGWRRDDGGDRALAHSTPEAFRFTSTDFNSYVTVSNAEGAPVRDNGFMAAGTAPGLGVTPRADVIGPRVVEIV